jgi:hypothetical protein
MKFGGTHETSQESGDMRHPSVRGEDQERHFEFFHNPQSRCLFDSNVQAEAHTVQSPTRGKSGSYSASSRG